MTAHQARQIIMDGESGVLLPEFTVYGVVIDLLAVDDTSLRGYEIKAATDRVTDGRFTTQLEQYRRQMEELTYVVAPRFLDHCEEVLPPWVGITSIEDDRLLVLRPPMPNPEADVRFIAKMLWKPEAAKVFGWFGLPVPRDARRYLQAEVAELLPEDELRAYVRRCIANRKWSAATQKGKPRDVVDRREVKGD